MVSALFFASDRNANCADMCCTAVALTRAQALLIVVGDPTVLCLDPVWRAFINHVRRNGGYRGKEADLDPEECDAQGDVGYEELLRARDTGLTEEIMQRVKSMVLSDLEIGTDVVDGENDDEAQFVENEWMGVSNI
jgi:helicase MOV-10